MFENLLAQFVPYATCLRYAQSDAGVLRWLVNLAGGFASSKLGTAFRITRYFCRAGMSAESNALRRVFEGVVANCRNRMSLLASPRSRNSLAIRTWLKAGCSMACASSRRREPACAAYGCAPPTKPVAMRFPATTRPRAALVNVSGSLKTLSLLIRSKVDFSGQSALPCPLKINRL